ncbi:MAG: efflux RND transporter permease subunit [Bacteroidales bacterium]|nr:efflux RND transporter permease subunit [Bacteroidales bacterium]
MNIRTFIDRPVLSSVISIFIVLGGIIGLVSLPIERYPNIAPPTVMVSTNYTGASAETVQKCVIVPLEEAINGVENMTYMESTATNSGSASIRIYFKQGTNVDMAAVNVQNCVSRATRQLPSEVTEIGVTVKKRQTNVLEQIALYSPNGTYDRVFIANYIKINLVPAISRIPGVGDIDVRGGDYGMRIWLKPDVMAQYKLIPSDITAALNEQNIEAATGSFGENADMTFEYALRYKGRLEKPEEFENIVIKALPNGEILRLKDVARVELGTQSYQFIGQVNQSPGANFSIYQTPGTNATEVIKQIDKIMAKAAEDFPADITYTVLSNANDFLYASIKKVVRTLIEAILLVILIVFVFLQSFRSTIIPLISTLVSVIGTFMLLYFAGFSINLLTLFALVLSIGVVVDDSIIVVEAVHAKFDSGYTNGRKAATDAMHDVTAALITSTLVFMAVFLPVSLIGGTSGTFYTQFGLTMAFSVGLSAINALTLSPALCAILLKPKNEENEKQGFGKRFSTAFESGFNAVKEKYISGAAFFIRHKWVAPALIVVSIGLLAYNLITTKTGLVPQEDMGVVRIDVTTPAGSSLAYTKGVMDRIEEDVIKKIPECRDYDNTAGFGVIAGQGASHGSFTLRLKDWSERHGKSHSVNAIMDRVKEQTLSINNASIFTSTQAMIPGYGATNGFQLFVQDTKGGSVEDLFQITSAFLNNLKERPEIGSANTSFNPNFPQYRIDLDAAKCKRAGISPKEVLSVLNGYFGGTISTKFNRFTKLYNVIVQAEPESRVDMQSLNNVFVRIGSDMAPVTQFVTLTKIYAPESLSRFNMFPSIAVNGRAAEGYSSGDAINAISEVAAETLPIGYSYEFGGITREEAANTNNTVIIFAICFVLIYLILSALYESYLLPLAVLLAVPTGLLGSFLLIRAMGLENNIYLQTGLIMLIGLVSKTAILITEYAVTKRRQGYTIAHSAIAAVKERFRPIIMTVMTMIIGLFPLLVSSGVGAIGNNTIGAGVIGGMTLGTIGLLFLTPCLYVVLEWLEEKIKPLRTEETE